jgi:hypothetical protein
LALGETQIVSQMQEFLEESGVHLDAFNQVQVAVFAKPMGAMCWLICIKNFCHKII